MKKFPKKILYQKEYEIENIEDYLYQVYDEQVKENLENIKNKKISNIDKILKIRKNSTLFTKKRIWKKSQKIHTLKQILF